MDQSKSCCQTILVVEDDDDIRNVLVDILESEGYQTIEASNGQEALDKLQDIPKPCLVLLDMMMPIMNGRQFLDAVMADTFLAPIPVLIVSAIADKTNSKGSIGFLKKPIDIDVVLKVVSQYCNTTTITQSDQVERSRGQGRGSSLHNASEELPPVS